MELLPLLAPLPQQSAVTCLLWPAENIIVFGLAEGKVETSGLSNSGSSS